MWCVYLRPVVSVLLRACVVCAIILLSNPTSLHATSPLLLQDDEGARHTHPNGVELISARSLPGVLMSFSKRPVRGIRPSTLIVAKDHIVTGLSIFVCGIVQCYFAPIIYSIFMTRSFNLNGHNTHMSSKLKIQLVVRFPSIYRSPSTSYQTALL